MRIKIIDSTGVEWYSECIGKVFEVHSKSRKGGKNKYVVRLDKEDRHLMNGYMYGWVHKKHCIKIPEIIDGKCVWCKEIVNFEQNEYEPTLEHGICKCGISYTRGKKKG